LQLQEDGCETFDADRPPDVAVTDRIILAVEAAQITPREEDGA